MKQYFAHRPSSPVTLLHDSWPRASARVTLPTRLSKRKEFIRRLKTIRSGKKRVQS